MTILYVQNCHFSLEMNPAFSERKMVATLKAVPNISATQVYLYYPAIYRSACSIDITNFPFDKQVSYEIYYCILE